MLEENESIINAYAKILKETKENLTEAKLTKQHFISLANMMKTAKTVDGLKEDILSWLKTTNPMFDETRFRTAAGMKK